MEETKEQSIEQASVQSFLNSKVNMTQEQKNSFQNIMLPFLNRVSSVQKLNDELDRTYDTGSMAEIQGRILIAEQELSGFRKYNNSFFEQNMDSVQDVLKEYISLKCFENIKNDSEYDFQESELEELQTQVRENINDLVNSQGRSTISDKGLTGFSSIDFAYDEIKECTPEEIAMMNDELRAKQSSSFEIAGISEFAKIDKEVAPEDRRQGLADITKAFSTPEVQKDVKQNDDVEIGA